MENLRNYIDGQWCSVNGVTSQDVPNPATGEVLGRVPLSGPAEVNHAAEAAQRALNDWRRVPASERARYLFRLKGLLEANVDDIARTITLECGKTLEESTGEVMRAIDNVGVACGVPTLSQGYNSEDVTRGVDEFMIRQPVGVCAAIGPFNFPAMIPFWFLPYAIACGNTFIVKPSERVPLTMQKVFGLVDQIGLPRGVLNLVNGSKGTVDAVIDHHSIRAISFVGSSAVARYVYGRAATAGKRVQCQGGAKNPVLVLPDADLDLSSRATAESAFGCAGQRCLAASLVITVGDVHAPFVDAMAAQATERVVGFGLDEGVQMGPVISPQSRDRIETIVGRAIEGGARIVVDGRTPKMDRYGRGNFIRPTLLEDIQPGSEIAKTEVFGPVLCVMHVKTIDDAIALVNSGQYGNMACLFTRSGNTARRFRYEANAGNIGINLGVAAPMASFPFSGWRESFFGDMHGQGMDAVEFFTQKKVVIERWPP